jgi:glycosyltransferase involved in cell wall biosynthesis
MLRSFAAYHLENPKSQLSIMGAGPLKSQLKLQSEELGISEVVYFLGRSAEVYEFLAGLDVFLLTSKYEGFGLVLLEAMDAKVPILAARNSAIPEVLGVDFPGLCETGNVEDFSNKILLLQDQNFRRQILTIQEERLSMFEASKMCERVNWIY